MGKQRLAHRHHTVPKVYLRGFAEDGRVDVRRRSGETRCLALDSVAVRTDFYNFRTSTGVKVGSVEQWFANHIEGPVGTVLGRLRRGENPAPGDVATLAAFVSAQLLRTVTTASRMEQIDDHLRPLLILIEVCKQQRIDMMTLSADQRAHLLRLAREASAPYFSAEDDRRSRLRTLLREADKIASQLSSWHWAVLASDNPVLITGDAPAVTIQTEDGWRGVLPAGSPVYLPLSPTRLLIGERVKLSDEQHLSAQLATAVNHAVAAEANDAIMTAPSVGWPSDIHLSRHRPTLPEPRVTLSRSNGQSTLPATYPTVASPQIRSLLRELEAIDTVD